MLAKNNELQSVHCLIIIDNRIIVKNKIKSLEIIKNTNKDNVEVFLNTRWNIRYSSKLLYVTIYEQHV